MNKILVVEDDIAIREKLVEFVSGEFDEIYQTDNEIDAYSIYQEKSPELLILDINLKYGNGLSLLRKIRKHDHNVKAIVLSAFNDANFLMEAIDLKLIKYLVKPIKRKEFKEAIELARLESEQYTINRKKILKLSSDYVWDYQSQTLLYKNETVELSHKETQLLSLMCDNKNVDLSYANIANLLWNYDTDDKTNAIKTIVKKLRKHIPKEVLINVYGIGYRLCV
jgi:DNA-binding response OmpR family regulator